MRLTALTFVIYSTKIKILKNFRIFQNNSDNGQKGRPERKNKNSENPVKASSSK